MKKTIIFKIRDYVYAMTLTTDIVVLCPCAFITAVVGYITQGLFQCILSVGLSTSCIILLTMFQMSGKFIITKRFPFDIDDIIQTEDEKRFKVKQFYLYDSYSPHIAMDIEEVETNKLFEDARPNWFTLVKIPKVREI